MGLQILESQRDNLATVSRLRCSAIGAGVESECYGRGHVIWGRTMIANRSMVGFKREPPICIKGRQVPRLVLSGVTG